MVITRIPVGPLMANCYLLADAPGGRAVLLDPGDEAELILDKLQGGSYSLAAIWLTHAHFDHVGALADITKHHQVPIYLHPKDRPLLEMAQEAAAQWDIPISKPPTEVTDIHDGATLKLGDIESRCLFTPGHAPGHIAFYFPGEGCVFAGDALFRGSIGRTDIPFGDSRQLLESIHQKLLTLPEDTVIYPGHGPETTIGNEAATNPFLTSQDPSRTFS